MTCICEDSDAKQEMIEMANSVCHEEQLVIWSGEILGALSMGDLMKNEMSYDDVLEAHRLVQDEIKSIVESAFTHPELCTAHDTQGKSGCEIQPES